MGQSLDFSELIGRFVIVEQMGSPLRRPAWQRQALIGLGLNKMHRKRRLQVTPELKGLLKKVSHLISVSIA